jgi:2,5-diketo-D-gluconate reductase B
MTEKTVAGVPQMGYGTWNRPGDEAYNGVLWALEAGCRHIDTAQGYQNEAEVGRAIADSGVPRSEIFLTTKVAPENYGKGEVMRTSRESLDKLGVERVDLLLLHWPSPHNEYPLQSYIAQFAEVFDAGMAKTIGVSNFTIPLIDQAQRLLGDRRIVMNQVEIHVFMQNQPIVRHCRAIGVPTTAYSPLARGAVVGDPLLTEVGKAHDATAAQVALAFLMAEGHIVIPSSGNKERIASNFAARTIDLDRGEVERLRGLEKGLRLVNGDWTPDWDE